MAEHEVLEAKCERQHLEAHAVVAVDRGVEAVVDRESTNAAPSRPHTDTRTTGLRYHTLEQWIASVIRTSGSVVWDRRSDGTHQGTE